MPKTKKRVYREAYQAKLSDAEYRSSVADGDGIKVTDGPMPSLDLRDIETFFEVNIKVRFAKMQDGSAEFQIGTDEWPNVHYSIKWDDFPDWETGYIVQEFFQHPPYIWQQLRWFFMAHLAKQVNSQDDCDQLFDEVIELQKRDYARILGAPAPAYKKMFEDEWGSTLLKPVFGGRPAAPLSADPEQFRKQFYNACDELRSGRRSNAISQTLIAEQLGLEADRTLRKHFQKMPFTYKEILKQWKAE